MATAPRPAAGREVDYPTSDGKPMAETETHRRLMVALIETLEARYEADPMTCVSGNLLLYYEEGNKRKHVSPDVFVVRGVAKRVRDYYLMWVEGKGPDLAIELTSKTTRNEDVKAKMALYRDVLRVSEYFLFDPFEEYLKPSLRGYRLAGGAYESIEPIAGRLPSAVLGLHLERDGWELRLFDPATGRRLPTTAERASRSESELVAERLNAAIAQATVAAERLRAERAEAERDALLRELEALRRQEEGGG